MPRSRRTLLIAAGGGGDALAAMMVADAARLDLSSTIVASFAWERTMFDPRPGPRPPEHFSGLRRRGHHNWQVTARSRLKEQRALSFLPRLAEACRPAIWLLDASEGVVGLRRQLSEAATLHAADRVLIVDVGGDILARGDEPWVKSPTADAMVLAATATLALVSYVVVLGLGLDGELGPHDIDDRLSRIDRSVTALPPTLPARTARRFADSFTWSPSEATGLAYMVARGWRGRAEIRRDGVEVELSGWAADITVYEADALLRRSRVAQAMKGTASFEDAEDVVRAFGVLPEREVERSVRADSRGRSSSSAEFQVLERRLLRYCEDAQRREVDYLTLRRIGEILDLDPSSLRGFVRFLSERHPGRLRPPAWRTR